MAENLLYRELEETVLLYRKKSLQFDMQTYKAIQWLEAKASIPD